MSKRQPETDKCDLRRSFALSEELWEQIRAYARARPPMNLTQAVKILIARGLHAETFDAKTYLSTSSIEDE